VLLTVADEEAALYIEYAREMLSAAAHNIAGGFYSSAVNRAYYAVFYAANALLTTQGISRSRHSGVIATFRQRFVKPGLIETEYGDIYGRIMDDRHVGDYDIEASIDPDRAQADLDEATQFVDRSERYLNERGLL
jgi:uncharacterized protein (UPF0332 family)